MEVQFINDEIRIKRYWQATQKQLKELVTWICGNIYLVIALVLLSYAFWYAGALFDNVVPNKPKGVEDFEDIRNVALTLAGLFSPSIAFLGLYVAERRYQTQVKQTDVLIGSALQQRYVDAINLLSQGKSYQKIAGITALRDPAIAANEVLMASAASTLTAHIRSRGKARAEENEDQRERRLREVFESIKSLFIIESSNEHQTAYRNGTIEFKNLDLGGLEFLFLPKVTEVLFIGCNFSRCRFFSTKMSSVIFHKCNFDHTRFVVDHLMSESGGFYLSSISGATISALSEGQTTTDFTYCKYSAFDPPTINNKSVLPPPWIENGELPEGGRFMTLEEANRFWDSEGNDIYRPRHGQNFHEIKYPENLDLKDC